MEAQELQQREERVKRFEIPAKCLDVLGQKTRYKVLYGGRGSSKSWSVARYLIAKGAYEKHRILCTREMQTSIKDSVYKLLCDQIYAMNMQHRFIILRDMIRSVTGTEFLFKGLKFNISEIKSTEGITICWCEEAEKISAESWDILIPTIRNEDSEIIITFNPEDEQAPTYQRFVVNHPDSCAKELINFNDNPWFPPALQREMEHDKKHDFEKYLYIWEGNPKKYGQSVIFKNKLRVETFEPADEGTQFYYGADWGFGVDPSCLIRMFIRDRILYIDNEFYGYGIEIDDLPACFDKVPKSREWAIRGDSARPDTISYMCKQGFNVQPAEKGANSVKDGIEFLQNFDAIIIHPSCTGSIGDFSNYRWKVDRVTDEVLPIPIDKSNHACDAARYALEPYMKQKVTIFDLDYSKINIIPNAGD